MMSQRFWHDLATEKQVQIQGILISDFSESTYIKSGWLSLWKQYHPEGSAVISCCFLEMVLLGLDPDFLGHDASLPVWYGCK